MTWDVRVRYWSTSHYHAVEIHISSIFTSNGVEFDLASGFESKAPMRCGDWRQTLKKIHCQGSGTRGRHQRRWSSPVLCRSTHVPHINATASSDSTADAAHCTHRRWFESLVPYDGYIAAAKATKSDSCDGRAKPSTEHLLSLHHSIKR